jgi:hypothetical protein
MNPKMTYDLAKINNDRGYIAGCRRGGCPYIVCIVGAVHRISVAVGPSVHGVRHTSCIEATSGT